MSIQLPNMKQIYAARDCLRDVLVNDQKLCPSVDKIEYVGQIERFGQLHYIFKFREPGGPWLVGVSGGYTSKNQIEPGEYVGSMGDAYNEGTVKGSAIALLDDMKSFMEGQEMDAIKSALEDEDVAGMVREIKALAEKSGLEISEDEIKKRVIDIMKSDDPSAFDDLGDDEGDGWGEMKDGIEHVILLKDHSLAINKAKAAIVKAFGGASKTKSTKTQDGGYQIQFMMYTIDIQLMGRPWELPKYHGSLGLWPGSPQAYESQKDALSIWVFSDHPMASNEGVAMTLTIATAACIEAFSKAALGVICAESIVPTDSYLQTAAVFREQGQFPIHNFIRPELLPVKDHEKLQLGTHGFSSLLGDEMGFDEPIPMDDIEKRWTDLSWIALQLLDKGKVARDIYMPGADGYAYRVHPVLRNKDFPIGVEMTHQLMLEDISFLWDNLKWNITGLRRACSGNRPTLFLNWAAKQGLMVPDKKQEWDAYGKANKDIRNIFWNQWSPQIMGDLLTEEGQAFAKAYYHLGFVIKGSVQSLKSYYADLGQYARTHIQHRRGETLEKAGVDAASLLPWNETIQKDAADMIQKRYEEWKKGK